MEHLLAIRGAADHNLQGIDLDLPLYTWVAVTGPSGSGKTSLVFGTLVREAERRYLGSLSARARHYFGKMARSQVDQLRGLPTTIAVGERAMSANPRSTVGTLTGILDLLRLVYARSAVPPPGSGALRLSRSHFSFNHPKGQCPACKGLGLEDQVSPDKLIANADKSIREGALVPTLKNGYTVYSQVTLDVMNQIAKAHGFDVDTPWAELNDEQRQVVLYGTQKLKVPFGKHPIESRMKWAGITARPREEGFYRGLIPVIEETLRRDRNPNILRFVRSIPCTQCKGTRLAELGRSARLGHWTLPKLLNLKSSELQGLCHGLSSEPTWKAVEASIDQRLLRLNHLGLGHLSLARESTTLSGGEAQRVRLAAQLGADLSEIMFALDEPTLGLHPESQEGLRDIFEQIIDRGNSLVVVEHDPDMVRHADYVVSLGPGAGLDGGRVVENETRSASAPASRTHNPLGTAPTPKSSQRKGTGEIQLTGATLHGLKGDALRLKGAAINIVIGPSGAGKSSLIFGTLLPALQGEVKGPYESLRVELLPAPARSGKRLAGPSKKSAIQAVDARPLGKTPRSTPATWCGLFDHVRKRFAATDQAKAMGLSGSHFSFNRGAGRCARCEGLGSIKLGLHLFQSFERICDSCGGLRYQDSILSVRWQGKSIAEVLSQSFAEAERFFAKDDTIRPFCSAMVKLGLGYLELGQASNSLSRGEAQRIKLGTLLGSTRKEPTIVLLDEPDRGLAPKDIAALSSALDALANEGHTIVAISHHRHLWAAADRLIELREGSITEDPEVNWAALSQRSPPRNRRIPSAPLELRGVTTHNIQNVNVEFPRHQITAVCGVSGSGKSSLVFATLASEAQRKFSESLPFQVRRFMKRLPRAELLSATGLTPTLSLRQREAQVSTRSTVATQSECGPWLRLLMSRAGRAHGEPVELLASHFSRDHALGACERCSGKGVLPACGEAKLITHPERPLSPSEADGALSGTRPGRFFTEAGGQHMATLRAALMASGISQAEAKVFVHERPWIDLPADVRSLALAGLGDRVLSVQWAMASKAEGSGTHSFDSAWVGLNRLVEQEAINRSKSKKASEWAAPLVQSPCAACDGVGLKPAAREVRLLGLSLQDAESLPLSQLRKQLDEAAVQEKDPVVAGVIGKLLPELRERLLEMESLGLGTLTLSERAQSLSLSELQRVRMSAALRSGLRGITLVLDEPDAGMGPAHIGQLMARLRCFRDQGNTVVLVSHHIETIQSADHVIEMGPKAGDEGGLIVASGKPSEIAKGNTPTGLAISQRAAANASPTKRKAPAPKIGLRNLVLGKVVIPELSLPSSGVVSVSGGPDRMSQLLVFDVVGASYLQATPMNCQFVTGPSPSEANPPWKAVVDTRISSQPKAALGTVLSFMNLTGDIASLFASASLKPQAFRLGHAAGRCSACKGTGREHVAMDFVADLDLVCGQCQGHRFNEEVLKVRWQGQSIAQVLELPASQFSRMLKGVEASKHTKKISLSLSGLGKLALGHLPLGRRMKDLSGGECVRLVLSQHLLKPQTPSLYLLNDVSAGLHEQDLQQVIQVLQDLGERGDLILANEQRSSFIAAADVAIDLAPFASK